MDLVLVGTFHCVFQPVLLLIELLYVERDRVRIGTRPQLHWIVQVNRSMPATILRIGRFLDVLGDFGLALDLAHVLATQECRSHTIPFNILFDIEAA